MNNANKDCSLALVEVSFFFLLLVRVTRKNLSFVILQKHIRHVMTLVSWNWTNFQRKDDFSRTKKKRKEALWIVCFHNFLLTDVLSSTSFFSYCWSEHEELLVDEKRHSGLIHFLWLFFFYLKMVKTCSIWRWQFNNQSNF